MLNYLDLTYASKVLSVEFKDKFEESKVLRSQQSCRRPG